MKPQRPPAHLRPATRAWWAAIARDYHLEDHHLLLLTAASEAWDRLQEARGRIAADGAYLADRFGVLRAHPAIGVETQARIGFARLIRELGLDLADPDAARPRRVGGAIS